MRRTRAGGDARLHDRWSIGVGGHLNPGDGDLAGGLRREWREELARRLRARVPPRSGCSNDDTTEVGSVHVGAVYVADAAGRPVEIRETDKLAGAFADRGRRWPRSSTGWRRGAPLVFEHLEGARALAVRYWPRRWPPPCPVGRGPRLPRIVVPADGGGLAARSRRGRAPPVARGRRPAHDRHRRQHDGQVPRRTSIAQAEDRRVAAVVIKLNTPGGEPRARRTTSSARCSRRRSRSSSGSRRRAASRRAPARSSPSPRTSRCMAPGTSIGAASPISGDGDGHPGHRSARRSRTTRSRRSPRSPNAAAPQRRVGGVARCATRSRRRPSEAVGGRARSTASPTTLEDVLAFANGKTVQVARPAGDDRRRRGDRSREQGDQPVPGDLPPAVRPDDRPPAVQHRLGRACWSSSTAPTS